MNAKKVQFYNAKVIMPHELIENACVIVKNGKIEAVTSKYTENFDGVEIDVHGKYLSPGFVDIHVHGGGGHDFMDANAEEFTRIAEIHAKHGTTSMCPTTLASSNEELFSVLENYKQAKNQSTGAGFLGLHLEGPYFSQEYKGAQDSRYIKKATPDDYKNILNKTDDILRWSAAPEVEGVTDFARYISRRGIVPSIAHTSALYSDVEKAIEVGFTHVTHLYSCMQGVTRINARRHGGTIEAALYEDGLTVEIIADGIHLPPELLKYVYKFKGSDKIALVTDAMRATGTDAHESILGSIKDGQMVIVEEGVAKLQDRSAFAGSVATADRLVRNMVKLANVPVVESVRMMTLTPSQIVGVDGKKGSLEVGKEADIIMFDENINIYFTMVKGNIIYSNI